MDFMQLCRLCLVRDHVNVPIFGNQDDIFLKITACLPIMLGKDDDFPKNICEGCVYKLDMAYQLYNTATSAEKQLLSWLNASLEIKPDTDTYFTATSIEVISVKQEPITYATDISDDCHDYLMQHDPLELVPAVDDKIEDHNESPAKRPRRSAAKLAKPIIESDDDEVVDDPITVTKTEYDSEIEGSVEEITKPTYLNESEPDTSKPGPSGLNTTAEAFPDYNTGTITPRKSEFSNCVSVSYTDPTYENGDCSNLVVNQGAPTTHERIHTDVKSYECSECNKRFSTKRVLIIHKRIHTGEKPYECSYCRKRFSEKGSLIRHERIHTGEKPYECSDCSKRFIHQGALTAHERIHTGEKPYECSYCNKCFATQSILTNHKRTHTGETPYECSDCSQRFVHKYSLTTHERIHAGEKPYECSDCSKRFTSQSALTSHTRIHTGEKPYECSYCSKRFAGKGALIRHARIHTGEKPYECLHCRKRFTDQSSLVVHERIHTGEKPYECSYCSKRFTDQSSFIKHKRIHISENPIEFPIKIAHS